MVLFDVFLFYDYHFCMCVCCERLIISTLILGSVYSDYAVYYVDIRLIFFHFVINNHDLYTSDFRRHMCFVIA